MKKKYNKFTPELKAEAKILFKAGVKCWTIGNQLNVPQGSVYYHLYPGAKKRLLARTKKWRIENREQYLANHRAQLKRDYERNPFKRRMASLRWYHRNAERARKTAAEWRKANPRRVKEQAKKFGKIKKIKRQRIAAIVKHYKEIIKENKHEHILTRGSVGRGQVR